jgi:hypothetical protein
MSLQLWQNVHQLLCLFNSVPLSVPEMSLFEEQNGLSSRRQLIFDTDLPVHSREQCSGELSSWHTS